MTALHKPSGGIRGIVVGDVFRRLVARTLAQQFAKRVESATAPFQYALSPRAGCECVSHALQSLTDLDESATILSVDGVGVDLVSRKAMLQGLLKMEGGDSLLPFARQFCGSPSAFLWEDTTQGEGGEQVDPLMPLFPSDCTGLRFQNDCTWESFCLHFMTICISNVHRVKSSVFQDLTISGE